MERLDSHLQSDEEDDGIGATILRAKRLASHLEITLEEQHRCLTSVLSTDNDILMPTVCDTITAARSPI